MEKLLFGTYEARTGLREQRSFEKKKTKKQILMVWTIHFLEYLLTQSKVSRTEIQIIFKGWMMVP